MVHNQLRYLADMNLSPQTVHALQTDGIDIIRVSEVLAVTTKDIDILVYARQEKRVIITQDLDFSTLVAIGGYAEPSLVTLRLVTSDPITVTQLLRRILPQVATALQEGSAITVDERTVRIRSLPIR